MAKEPKNKMWAGVPSPIDRDDDAKYRAEDDLRTLTRAREIEKDKSRMSMVKKIAADKIKSMKEIC
jgi:hypothetical protein